MAEAYFIINYVHFIKVLNCKSYLVYCKWKIYSCYTADITKPYFNNILFIVV